MEMNEVLENMFLPLPGVPPILIKKAEGVYLEDASGMRILDATGGPMVVNMGYGRKEVAEAAAKSVAEVSYVLPVFASEVRIELVKDKSTKEPFPKDKNLKMNLITLCMLKGLFFYPGYYEDTQGRGDHIMVAPPFIITEEQIDTCVEVLGKSLKELCGT